MLAHTDTPIAEKASSLGKTDQMPHKPVKNISNPCPNKTAARDFRSLICSSLSFLKRAIFASILIIWAVGREASPPVGTTVTTDLAIGDDTVS